MGSTIDYFLVSDRISACVRSVQAMDGWPHTPHVPISLVLDGDPRVTKETAIVTPKKFPIDRPVGCAREPFVFKSTFENAGDDAEMRAWSHLCHLWDGIEHELIGLFDLVGPDDVAYRGRADGPRFVNRPVLFPRGHGDARTDSTSGS